MKELTKLENKLFGEISELLCLGNEFTGNTADKITKKYANLIYQLGAKETLEKIKEYAKTNCISVSDKTILGLLIKHLTKKNE